MAKAACQIHNKGLSAMNCRVCERAANPIFSGYILQYNVQYFYCDYCGFLFTEDPYWLEEAYKESITHLDTGILHRNLLLSKTASIVIFFLFNRNAKFLDYAGGYGIFVRLMRDVGFDFYWHDKFSNNLLARGFGHSIEETRDFELLTCFEAFEHFINPIEDIKKLLEVADDILFSTRILPKRLPKPKEWWYYGLDHGQHISFYSIKTLKYIANRFNLKFYSNEIGTHLFSRKRINPILIKFLLLGGKFGLFPYVKAMMRSKTFKDIEYLRKKSNEKL